MLKLLFTINFFAASFISFSQSDVIIIKKNGRPVKTFFKGSVVDFKTNTGEWFHSTISGIRDDSLFFRELVVRQVMTQFGVTRMDTMTTYTRAIYYKDIVAIPKPRSGLGIKPETLMMLGGGGYAALNLINSAYLHYAPFGKDNRSKLLPALGVATVGYVISRFRKYHLPIGKKYTLHYVPLRKP